MARNLTAVILAAGRGERLRPYTDTSPKCLVPFAGHALLQWQIASLRAGGIREIEIVGGYRHEALEPFGLPIRLNAEWARTNMVESLQRARDTLLAGAGGVIAYGDILYEPRIVESLLASQHDVAVVADRSWLELAEARSADPLDDVETFRTDGHGRILEMGCKARSLEEIEAQYVGLIKLTAAGATGLFDFLDAADDDAPWLHGRTVGTCHMTDLLGGLVAASLPVGAVLVDAGWCEFDTVEDLELYAELRDERQLGRVIDLPIEPGTWSP